MSDDEKREAVGYTVYDEKKYRDDQPRASAGTSEGGQWIFVSGYARDRERNRNDSRIRLAENETSQNDSTNDIIGETIRKIQNDGANTPQPAQNLSASEDGVDFVASHEKFRNKTYLDEAGYSTIGYGHKLLPEESFPKGITESEAQKLLASDLNTAQSAVRNNVEVPITQNQFDALVSLAYNIGRSSFSNSTLLKLLNQGKYDSAADQFLLWNKVRIGDKLKTSSGLTGRREKERDMFLDKP